MPVEEIKSYLVKLGFKVDSEGAKNFNNTLSKLTGIVESCTQGMSRSWVTASGVIVTSLASIMAGTASLANSVAQADLGFQRYAMRMYMTRDAARQLKIVTDAMGESLEDIAWIPELQERYRTLMGYARGLEEMGMGGGAEGSLRYIRDIRMEFTRLKIEIAYGSRMIVSDLFKYLMQPTAQIKWGFKDINDYITENLPRWSDTIAKWLSKILIVGKDVGIAALDLKEKLGELWNSLPKEAKVPAGLLALAALFAFSGPFGKAAIVITGLTLLINDFYTALRGGENITFPALKKFDWWIFKIWRSLIEFRKSLYQPTEEESKAMFGKPSHLLTEEEKRQWRISKGIEVKTPEELRKEWEEDWERSIKEGIPRPTMPEYWRSFLGHESPAAKTMGNIDEIIRKASEKYKINPMFLKRMIEVESGFKTGAVSPKGAKGLMQLMPGTAERYGVTNIFDPYQNIMAGTAEFRRLMNLYKGNTQMALAAYNWGQANVARLGMERMPLETREYLGKFKGISPETNINVTVYNNVDKPLDEEELAKQILEQRLRGQSILDIGMKGYAGGVTR